MEWISVEDSIPEMKHVDGEYEHWISTRVIVLRDNGYITIAEREDDGERLGVMWVDESGYSFKNVTHWMPLPEPPKDA